MSKSIEELTKNFKEEEKKENEGYRKKLAKLYKLPQYEDIDKFQKYEFTECIAFEFAVRSAKNLLIEIFKEAIEYKKNKPNNILNYFSTNNYKIKENLLLKKYGLYFHNFVRLSPNTFSYSYANYYSFFIPYYQKLIKTKLIIKDEETYKEIILNGKKNIIKLYSRPAQPTTIGLKGNTYRYTTKYFEIISNNIHNTNSIINKITSRPKLYIPPKNQKKINIEINPILPKNENEAYINEILKEIYQKSNTILSNIELESITNPLININYNDITGLRKKYKEMLFCYDCISDSHQKYSLNKELYILLSMIIKKNPKTIQEYYLHAKKLVDNQNYKSLISIYPQNI